MRHASDSCWWAPTRKLRWGGRPADPGPEDLAHRTEVQILASLQEIDNGAVVPVIPHREENVMAMVVALDDDLVRAAPQHRASPPALAPVHLIAETDGKLAQVNLPFEGIEFAILVHKNTFSFPIAHFSFPAHGAIGPLPPPYPPPAWCANCAGRT